MVLLVVPLVWEFGNCLGCFAASIGIASSLDVKLHAVIHVVDLAWENG